MLFIYEGWEDGWIRGLGLADASCYIYVQLNHFAVYHKLT